jgi:hypothetical protein
MKRFVAMLTVTLTILALPGCVNDKPAPRLDSPDRTERIKAVRQARNRYGVPAKPAENKPAQPPPIPAVIMPAILPVPSPLAFGDPLAADRNAIVGRWHLRGDMGDEYCQFEANGTFKEEDVINTIRGNWRLLSPDTIELSALKYSNPIFFFNPTVLKWKYRVESQKLVLRSEDGWALYSKVTH